MKTLMISLLALGSVANTFAQDVLYETKVQNEKLPNIVIGSVKERTPEFVYQEFNTVPTKQTDKVVSNSTKDLNEYQTYQVTLYGQNKKITNTYDQSGKLIASKEVAKNEKLPVEIAESLEKTYPGWAIANDVYRMNRYKDDTEEESYKVILEKGNQKMKIYLDATGGILNTQLKDVNTI